MIKWKTFSASLLMMETNYIPYTDGSSNFAGVIQCVYKREI